MKSLPTLTFTLAGKASSSHSGSEPLPAAPSPKDFSLEPDFYVLRGADDNGADECELGIQGNFKADPSKRKS